MLLGFPGGTHGYGLSWEATVCDICSFPREGRAELQFRPTISQARDQDIPHGPSLPLGGKMMEKGNRKAVLAIGSWWMCLSSLLKAR